MNFKEIIFHEVKETRKILNTKFYLNREEELTEIFMLKDAIKVGSKNEKAWKYT